MKKLLIATLLLSSGATAGEVWDKIVGDRHRNKASLYCIDDGISAAGYFTKNKELVDARYELCIAQYTNQYIEEEIVQEIEISQELEAIQKQINELIRRREEMLKGMS